MAGKRRQAREEALQLLYALEISRNSVKEVMKDSYMIRPDGSPFDEFTVKLVKNAAKVSRECDTLIEKHARNWDLNRIALIDSLILKLALSEFLCFPDIPPKVSINEALEIAKRFSTGDSPRFINGVLNAVLGELISQDRICKEGRGLDDKAATRRGKKITNVE